MEFFHTTYSDYGFLSPNSSQIFPYFLSYPYPHPFFLSLPLEYKQTFKIIIKFNKPKKNKTNKEKQKSKEKLKRDSDKCRDTSYYSQESHINTKPDTIIYTQRICKVEKKSLDKAL